ncbi:MAG: methylmalonyl Co-A mutase-associated GTPase MeaB [Planctomycetes bacterium]|nr:methylmalonyl Co-A mutase-associated GTPase MeaB [Planctomycetota bacterium]MDP6409533.1 methylmalonyl Co-A mutase-associated GTPase MeaB [Planctomycetota bacterium]
MSSAADIVERLKAGERAAVARLISWAENGDPRFGGALGALFERVGRGRRTGITGPPGAGKSTLTNEFTGLSRAAGRTVGILAVDPSSPFSGGALLGDRIRMEERTSDSGVFIRSMASRGSHGGLARAAIDACDVMDAFGFEELLVETVGVGQAEFDVMEAVDTVVVVLCPGAGDGIQAMKAGLLEVADVLVVNKADVAGAERLLTDLEDAVSLRRRAEGAWEPPVVACAAGRGEGVTGVWEAVERHRAWLAVDGHLEARRARLRLAQVRGAVAEGLDGRLWRSGGLDERARALLAAGETPYDVAAELLSAVSAGSVEPEEVSGS